jgi:AcrR family transcriptional regulator
MARQPERPASDTTRQALVEAALDGFGVKGFEGTSTRHIAQAAKTNIASIAYHFGGKEGLRRACAEFVVATIRSVAEAVLRPEDEAAFAGLDRAAARQRIAAIIERMAGFILTNPRANLVVRFMLREMIQPSVALDIIYGGIIEPTHKRLCRLWAAATGEEAESETTRLAVFAMMGQVLYFRIGREIVVRRMGWDRLGKDEAQAIAAVLKGNLDALLKAGKERAS